jgi:hypothetical protein
MNKEPQITIDRYYISALYDHHIIRESLVNTKRTKAHHKSRVDPNHVDSIPFPEYYLLIQHMHSFMEKSLKTIAVHFAPDKQCEIRKTYHNLNKLIGILPSNFLKEKLSEEAFYVLEHFRSIDYPAFRYIDKKMKIPFSSFSSEQLITEIRDITNKLRSELYQREYQNIEQPNISVSMGEELTTAPKRIATSVFEDMLTKQPEQNQKIIASYTKMVSYYLLNKNCTPETLAEIAPIVKKETGLFYSDEMCFTIE